MKILGEYGTWREFPMLPKTVPDALLSNDWALKIHDQALKRLDERGGMSVLELLMNIEKTTAREFMLKAIKKTTQADVDRLLSYIKDFELSELDRLQNSEQ